MLLSTADEGDVDVIHHVRYEQEARGAGGCLQLDCGRWGRNQEPFAREANPLAVRPEFYNFGYARVLQVVRPIL